MGVHAARLWQEIVTVYFIVAGPGDPELITIKGQKRIAACPVILYAGSLVPRAIFADICCAFRRHRPAGCQEQDTKKRKPTHQ